ncbi:YolD-like protein [compost metagenome]
MAGKLEANGLWESSRMMLPEHKEAIIRAGRERDRRTKPMVDAQELELIERALSESLRGRAAVTVRLWGEYEDTELRGVVTSIHTHSREIKLQQGEDWQWIKIRDIVGAYR